MIEIASIIYFLYILYINKYIQISNERKSMKTNCIKHSIMTFLTILCLQYSILSIAHEGHAHPLEKNQIIEKANKVISMAIEQKKLAPSWEDAKIVETKVLEEKGGQWLVQFNNPSIKNGEENLYIFFSLDGKYIAMNHTGK
jgi:hypothetical protein